MLNRYFLLLFSLLFNVVAFAQNPDAIEMADAMRSSGKIYVVIAVIAVIFAGLLAYLLYLERRVQRLENEK
ncbi:MAG: CcmD family protein [Chitinophagales bacterium]|jgi:CcmD family protein|nr:CcmD family protein [Sphingobacteriales bacterium]MBP6664822.1 CcmD family protein [Chitinophagales bacterium]MBP7533363.1 CcmD family protein [Chitinophagales bacterium]